MIKLQVDKNDQVSRLNKSNVKSVAVRRVGFICSCLSF